MHACKSKLTRLFDEGQEGNAGNYLTNNSLNFALYFFEGLHTTFAPVKFENWKLLTGQELTVFKIHGPLLHNFFIVFNIENPAFESFFTAETQMMPIVWMWAHGCV